MISKIIMGLSRRFVNKLGQNYIEDIKNDFSENGVYYQHYFYKKIYIV